MQPAESIYHSNNYRKEATDLRGSGWGTLRGVGGRRRRKEMIMLHFNFLLHCKTSQKLKVAHDFLH